MKLNELLKDLEVKMVESQDDIYADEILVDIDNWLMKRQKSKITLKKSLESKTSTKGLEVP